MSDAKSHLKFEGVVFFDWTMLFCLNFEMEKSGEQSLNSLETYVCGGCCQRTSPKVSSLPKQWRSDAKEIALVLKDRMPFWLPGDELIVTKQQTAALPVTAVMIFLRQNMVLQWRNLD